MPPGAPSYRLDPAVPDFPDDKPLMIFDGFCGLCSRSVQFVLRHDKAGQFRFLAAQTGLGTAIYRHFGLDADDYSTFILLADGKAWYVSDAAIEVARRLTWPWSMAPLLKVVPPALRDQLYGLVARNRMRFFGRTEACYLPAPAERDRFLVGD